MKILEPKVEEIKDFEGVDNFYKATARAARVCYASDKTTEDKKLVERLLESKHFSPFEHAIIYIDQRAMGELTSYPHESAELFQTNLMHDIVFNKYAIKTSYIWKDYEYKNGAYIYNGRVIIESIVRNITDKPVIETLELVLKWLKQFEIKELQAKEFKFKSFIIDTSIGCTREMNRHHDNFYICECSTRYCNYAKDKFGKEVAFNKPYWYDNASYAKQNKWEFAMRQAENNYIDNAVSDEFTTDEIRGVLPLDTHTRAIYTATIEEWNHIIDLRLKGTTGKPHGDIMVITKKIADLLN